jgi:aminoglycoside phosphotransferase (APT) family kinase protein
MSIPEDKATAVARALQAAFGAERPDTVARVSGGLSGAGTWRIGVADRAYLLRIEAGRDELRDPVRHHACLRIASEAGVAPRLRYADAEDGVAIMDFVQVQPFPDADAPARPQFIAELGRRLAALHAAPAFPPLVDYMDGVASLITAFRQLRVLEEAATAELFERYAAVDAAYPRRAGDQVSSHNDLNGRNVLWDGDRIWFVDWEIAFRADRYGDLASLANLSAHTPQAEAQMLEAYFGRPAQAEERARLAVMRQVNHLYYGLVLLNFATFEAPGLRYPGAVIEAPPLAEIHAGLRAGTFPLETLEGRTLYGRSRLNAALEGMRLPAFAQALGRLAA